MQFETHQDAVDLVKQIFISMGGRVVPPRRPGHKEKYEIITPEWDTFLLDFENSCLSQYSKPHPKGSKRYEDPEWATLIQSQVYPHHSDVDWQEYVDWVSRGFGDEWFQDDEPRARKIDHLFCKKHNSGPLDVWYDCDACLQEVQTGPMPQDGRYQLVYTS